jgi:hypothetical protein
MCNIRLKVKYDSLIGLNFGILAVHVEFVNDPWVKLFFFLVFEFLFQGVFMILEISLARNGMVVVVGMVFGVLELREDGYSEEESAEERPLEDGERHCVDSA